MYGMRIQGTSRKVKRSFTLTQESVAFIRKTRKKHRTRSDSETLDLLLSELQTKAKLRELDASVKAYYDGATNEELREQREWAEGTGPNMFAGIPE
jgi:hypothetical protein